MLAVSPWRFYVYELFDAAGDVQYVGKGSGKRLTAQKRNHSLDGREVARFKRESDAYSYEIKRIADVCPPRNVHPGGNGPRSKRIIYRKPKWLLEIERIGTRCYAARAIANHVYNSNASPLYKMLILMIALAPEPMNGR
jgi:hypothetical protein